MKQQWLAWVGGIALLVVGGAGVLAWVQVEEQLAVRVRAQAQADARIGEQLSLLRDENAALRADLGALTSALEQNFQSLIQALEEEAQVGASQATQAQQATQLELSKLGQEIARLRAAQVLSEQWEERLAAILATVPGKVAEQGGSAGSASDQAPTAAGPTTSDPLVALTPANDSGLTEPEAKEEDVQPQSEALAGLPQTAPGPGAPAKSGSFLSFRLPSASFSWSERQNWVLLDGLARVGFDAKTTLHDFSAATTAVHGSFTTALATPESGTSGTIVVEAAKLDSQEAKRDAQMHSLLDVAKYPRMEYVIERFEPRLIDEAAGTLEGRVHGQMTIHGQSRTLTLDVRASLDASKRLLLEGDGPLKLSDFGVEAPNKLGLIVMEDEVRIWIALRARSSGKAQPEEGGSDGD